MKLSDKVCSVESAKKLKELGVNQKSLFYWNFVVWSSIKPGENTAIRQSGFNLVNTHWEGDGEWYAAFDVAELGEMLPMNRRGLRINDLREDNEVPKETPYFWEVNGFFGYEKTEAEARAQMLVYLLENKLITL